MKKNLYILITVILVALLGINSGFAEDEMFTNEEMIWLERHSDEVLKLGLDPYSGMDFFSYREEQKGYIIDVVKLLEDSTGLTIEIVGDQTWGEVYEGLIQGDIDILFGANVTPERLKFMSFTEPIHKNPYAVFSNESSQIRTIGDLDKKRVGFIEGDIGIELFSQSYQNIQFEVVEFAGQPEGLKGLENNEIDGFITSGGGIVYDFIYHYPDISFVAEVQDITSDMTLATQLEDEILANILSKVIENHLENEITGYIKTAETLYNRKLLQLTKRELFWLDNDGKAVVGVVSDYLPFDHYEGGEYKGITGEILKEIENIIGIEFEYVYGDFDTIYQKTLDGEIEILNIAKTDERLSSFIFPRSFSEERDLIYGQKDAVHVQDIYGLEGKSVAVIKGFWHEEFLNKNLRNVNIVETDSIKESLKLVNRGDVDYFIENPTVAEYYISGLGYWNIVKKGETSTDSFLYFGVNIDQPVIASLMDKALLLVDYDMAKQRGLDTVPSLMSRSVYYMIWVILVLLLVISVVVYILIRSMKSLIRERESSAVLKEREHMMYLDPLTGLNNRLYYNSIEETLDMKLYPQSIIISDLNHLKHINDTMGHHMGDAYIKAYGQLLSEAAEAAIVCRMGGDEFIIIMTDCDAKCTDEMIRKIRKQAKKIVIEVDEHKIKKVDAAIGYALRYDQYTSLEEVMIEADNKMYANKKKQKLS